MKFLKQIETNTEDLNQNLKNHKVPKLFNEIPILVKPINYEDFDKIADEGSFTIKKISKSTYSTAPAIVRRSASKEIYVFKQVRKSLFSNN